MVQEAIYQQNNSIVITTGKRGVSMTGVTDDESIELDQLDEEAVADMDGIVIGDNGRPRFTVEVVDNTGARPYEE